MDIQTIRKDINLSRIIDEVEKYIFSIDSFDDQICLQSIDEETSPFYGSRGLKEIDSEYTEKDFSVSIFSEMIYTNKIVEELGLCRTRIMRMKPKTCLSYHYDPTPRIHIPLLSLIHISEPTRPY